MEIKEEDLNRVPKGSPMLVRRLPYCKDRLISVEEFKKGVQYFKLIPFPSVGDPPFGTTVRVRNESGTIKSTLLLDADAMDFVFGRKAYRDEFVYVKGIPLKQKEFMLKMLGRLLIEGFTW